jgi:alpha-beta hydrolase superfamily lysophospholipase
VEGTILRPDILGQPYQQLTMDFGGDDEGPVVATLVVRRAPAPTRRAVLWLHGWSDYFFQTHVADFFVDRGFDFYALDLRKYGRSLNGHQTPGFCQNLTDYDPELDQAARLIRNDHDLLLLAAHSTGGLIAALWADRRPGMVDGLILNSPFFDINAPGWLRVPASLAVVRAARRDPYRILRHPTYPVYAHSLHADFRGEWRYDLAWKPVGGFPIRYGWLAAVRAGQRRLHAGLAIEPPVLVGCSTRSLRSPRWSDRAQRADTVLNVADIVRWAPRLGQRVTVLRVEGGLHDLTLSAQAVRAAYLTELDRWIAANLPSPPPPATADTSPLAATAPETPPTGAHAAPAAPG